MKLIRNWSVIHTCTLTLFELLTKLKSVLDGIPQFPWQISGLPKKWSSSELRSGGTLEPAKLVGGAHLQYPVKRFGRFYFQSDILYLYYMVVEKWICTHCLHSCFPGHSTIRYFTSRFDGVGHCIKFFIQFFCGPSKLPLVVNFKTVRNQTCGFCRYLRTT